MPSRMACVAILSFWVYATFGLLRRDVLPDLMITPPPDLRTIAGAEEDARPSAWDIQVAEDASLKNVRSVGRATTRSRRAGDGSTELISTVGFDPGGLLRGTPFASQHNEKIEISNVCTIDKSGNLVSFHAEVRSADDAAALSTLDGRVGDRKLEIRARSPLAILNRSWSLPYEPRGMVQNALGPIDRMPGLQVGQRWETRIVNPFTGRVEVVTVEVAGRHATHWGKGVFPTLEVVHHMSPTLKARTWVRGDGLVLRQEVPFPFVKLVLERIPSLGDASQAEAKAP